MLLPKHPFIPFRELVNRFATKYISSPWRKKAFIAFSSFWEKITGLQHKQDIIKRAFAEGRDGYDHTTWHFAQLFYPEISASFFMTPLEEYDYLITAAKTIVSALQFRQKILEGSFETEYEAGKPLDMQRYHFLFSRLNISRVVNGQIEHHRYDHNLSEHIIIAMDGYFFRLKVIENHQILPIEWIHRQLVLIQQELSQPLFPTENPYFPFGTLSTLANKTSAKIYETLALENQDTVEALNSGLFILAIDRDSAPQNTESFARSIHVENYHNRDYRRSMQIVVTANSRVGIIVNPHHGIGGSLSARFILELKRGIQKINFEFLTDPITQTHYTKLIFKANLLPINKKISQLNHQIQYYLFPKGMPSIFKLVNVGKKKFATLNISADAAFHCAIHAAFFHLYHKVPVVGNFINLRNVQHGDIWRYISTSSEIKAYVENPCYDTLTLAIQQHKEKIKETKKAEDELYQAIMMIIYLVRTKKIYFLSAVFYQLGLSLLIPNFSRQFINPDIWISNIATNSGIQLAGRPSTQLSFTSSHSIAGHYLIFEDHIMTCLVPNLKGSKFLGLEALFHQELQIQLDKIIAIAEEHSELTREKITDYSAEKSKSEPAELI